MTLKIDRIREKAGTRVRLSGELRSAHLEDLRTECARMTAPLVLDLEEVDLVDLDAVRWLNGCQTRGVRVENRTPYIREWMDQERLGDET